MKRTNLLSVALALVSIPCCAGVYEIKQFFKMALASDGAVPTMKEFFSVVDEDTVRALSVQEVNEVLPLAKQALLSPKTEIFQYGMGFFMAVDLRLSDASIILEPYVDDLGALANAPETSQPLRHGVLYILGMTQPKVVPKAIPYLLGNLENKANSSQDTGIIADALLQTFPADRAIIDKILKVAKGDTSLTSVVLWRFGEMKTRDPQALSLIGSSLDSADASIRHAAVQAASRLDREVRAQFARQLGRIAVDNNESPDLRSMATAALGQ